jgi:hypothetical protein
MTTKVVFLRVAGFRVIDEVIALMHPDNPVLECRELPAMIKSLAGELPARTKEPPWREVIGSSGGLYRVYVSETEPFIVYAVIKRDDVPGEMFVLHVGLRGSQRQALFYRALRAEIDRRLKFQGWLP